MPVPTLISQLSTTASLNSPDGAVDAPSSIDDYQRAHAAFIAQLHANTVAAATVIVPSATTTDIGAAASENVDISGTTTITGFGTVAEGINRKGRFTGALILTHNATSLILPGNANITTAANDRYEARSLGGGNWIVTKYVYANGNVISATTATTATNLAGGSGGTIPYQSAAGATAMLANGTAGQVLKSRGTTLSPEWGTSASPQIQPISASVASNALTISASALTLDFRSTTLGSGAVTTVTGTPANLVISSGSTLGTVNAVQSRIAVIALNNAGTIELAAVNIAGGNDLSETGVISTTAEGGAGAADSASVVYSTTARTGVAYRVIGYIESTQTTAGTWATAPSTIQGHGGQALAAMSSLGYGQTWQGVTRAVSTTYYNTTGKPIVLSLYGTPSVVGLAIVFTINGSTAHYSTGAAASAPLGVDCVIPVGASYSFAPNSGTYTAITAFELR